MENLDLLIDLHCDGLRQGPGSDATTRQAVALSGLGRREGLEIADIGCGTGASTRVLARELDASIAAVDVLQEFLGELQSSARREKLGDRIAVQIASMDALPFAEASLDAIWSEGAIYNMGFSRGVSYWRRFLRPDGVLAVSELTWLTHERPAELHRHWRREYPEVGTAAEKMAVLEQQGFSPIGYFTLPRECWLENYYHPLRNRFAAFLARHDHSDAAQAIVASETEEIALYQQFHRFYGYGFYLARRVEG